MKEKNNNLKDAKETIEILKMFAKWALEVKNQFFTTKKNNKASLWKKIMKIRVDLAKSLSQKGGRVNFGKVNYDYFDINQIYSALIPLEAKNKVSFYSINKSAEVMELWGIDLETGYKEKLKNFPRVFSGANGEHKTQASIETYGKRQMLIHLFMLNTKELTDFDILAEEGETKKSSVKQVKATPNKVVKKTLSKLSKKEELKQSITNKLKFINNQKQGDPNYQGLWDNITGKIKAIGDIKELSEIFALETETQVEILGMIDKETNDFNTKRLDANSGEIDIEKIINN